MKKHKEPFFKTWRRKFFLKTLLNRLAMTLATALLALGMVTSEGLPHISYGENDPVLPMTTNSLHASGAPNVSAQTMTFSSTTGKLKHW